jgi:hypothetical protein
MPRTLPNRLRLAGLLAAAAASGLALLKFRQVRQSRQAEAPPATGDDVS